MSSDSLRIFTPVLADQVYDEDVTRRAIKPEPSYLFNGGFWQLPFRLVAESGDPQDLERLVTRFRNWLGYHVEQQYKGAVIWEGMICQLDLAWGRTRKRRSLIDPEVPVHNSVRALHSSGATSWYTDDNSIARYGRIEVELDHSGVSSTMASYLAQMHLQRYAWPRPFPVAFSQRALTPALDVLACGYIVTASWRMASSKLLPSTVEELFTDLIDDCEFLSVGQIASNTLSVTEYEGETPLAVFDYLLGLGDASQNRYRYHVGPGREFFVEQVDYSPRFRISSDGIRQRLGGPILDPREVRPGVFRDETWPLQDPPPDSPFESDQDTFVEEVIVRPGQALPELRSGNLDGDLYAAAVEKDGISGEMEKKFAERRFESRFAIDN